MIPTEASRRLQGYAKRFGAGAFAAPTAKEIAAAPGSLVEWDDGATIGWVKRLTRDSVRVDFTGRHYTVPAGAVILAHVAREPDAPVPDVEPFDYVSGYPEDRALALGLAAQGREVRAVRVSAASELIALWGREGEGHRYPDHDLATVVEAEVSVPSSTRAAVLAEVEGVTGWHDDYPYYNRDGSWSSLSLRGFQPDDPTWGVKPAEMNKTWLTEHPGSLAMKCDWTVLAERMPATTALIGTISWLGDLERVRLLRMSGRGGKGGTLLRHSDITDRWAGTADGHIARWHLPIITDPAVTMQTWELDGVERNVHLAPWRFYYLDQRKPHAVTNPTAIDRVHLVVDAVVDEDVRRQIAQGARR